MTFKHKKCGTGNELWCWKLDMHQRTLSHLSIKSESPMRRLWEFGICLQFVVSCAQHFLVPIWSNSFSFLDWINNSPILVWQKDCFNWQFEWLWFSLVNAPLIQKRTEVFLKMLFPKTCVLWHFQVGCLPQAKQEETAQAVCHCEWSLLCLLCFCIFVGFQLVDFYHGSCWRCQLQEWLK